MFGRNFCPDKKINIWGMLKKYNLSSKLEKMICIGSELIGNTSCIP